MNGNAWVAHTSRGLVAVFHRDELSSSAAMPVTVTPAGKFVAAERRRYLDGELTAR